MLWFNQLLIKILMKINDLLWQGSWKMFLQYILAEANKKYQDKKIKNKNQIIKLVRKFNNIIQ